VCVLTFSISLLLCREVFSNLSRGNHSTSQFTTNSTRSGSSLSKKCPQVMWLSLKAPSSSAMKSCVACLIYHFSLTQMTMYVCRAVSSRMPREKQITRFHSPRSSRPTRTRPSQPLSATLSQPRSTPTSSFQTMDSRQTISSSTRWPFKELMLSSLTLNLRSVANVTALSDFDFSFNSPKNDSSPN